MNGRWGFGAPPPTRIGFFLGRSHDLWSGFATFPSFEIAAKVLGNLKAYQNYLNARN
jgi:hypothetical protein